MISYSRPEGVQASEVGGRPVLITSNGGKIAVDPPLLQLWEQASTQTWTEILKKNHLTENSELVTQCALACLAEAGLLERKHDKDQFPIQNHESISGVGLVSVVIVGYNSREWLDECLPSLFVQTYQPLEIVLVDNGSQDDTLGWLKAKFPQVHVVYLEKTLSLATAINMGIEMTSGDYFLILNPDVRLEEDAVAQLIKVANQNHKIAAVAAKLKFWWAPSFLNGIGNRVGPFSWGTDNALGHLDLGQYDDWSELPSACFAAALIPRQVWERVGPIDAGFPMYYEDLEWCYRARLFGYKIQAAPQAVVYHAFGGRIPTGMEIDLKPSKLRNVVYGRYRFLYKILNDYRARFLRNYILEDATHFIRMLVSRKWNLAQAYLEAWKDVIQQRFALRNIRRDVQAKRKLLSDKSLFGLQADMPRPHIWRGMPELTWDLISNYYLPIIISGRTRTMPEFGPETQHSRLLIISHEIVNKKMAGPGMRYLEMARALNSDLDVTLAIPAETDLKISDLRIVCYDPEKSKSLKTFVDDSDVTLISGYMVEKYPFLETTTTRLVVDLYDPMVLENLHYYLSEPMTIQKAYNQRAVEIMNRLVRLGDFFICGNDRQRDFWLGVLTSNGRVNPLTFQQDSELKLLIDVVGIGFPSHQPKHTQSIVRGKHPQVPDDARIILWGGGIWNWLDPLNLVKAWPQVLSKYPQARLIFLGTRHPNPSAPAHEMVQKTISLADEIGEKDRTILFYDWIEYEARESLLLEADVGVALHPVHVETRYSARTRILDYFWARLPVLVTEGDVTSEWVREYNLGQVAPESDPLGVADALIKILDQPKTAYQDAFASLENRFSWPVVVQPLLHYCLTGDYASDRRERLGHNKPPNSGSIKSRFMRVWFIWRIGGTKVFLHRVWRYIQWRLSIP
jgi:GT2 family glycosyltransferase